MSGDLVIQLAQEALMIVLLVSAPMLGLGLIVGLLVAVFQATTSIQEQTLAFIPKIIADIAAGHISIKYGFRGPNFATVSACASSTNAIADAFNYIRLGKANAIVAGGARPAGAACAPRPA